MIIGGVEGRGCEMLTRSFAWQHVVMWDIILRREVQVWEIDEVLVLIGRLYDGWDRGRIDSLRWRPSSVGSFLMKSFFFFIYQILGGSVVWTFPWKAIQVTRAPTKVSFFVWCGSK